MNRAEEKLLSRRKQVTFSRLWSDHHPDLRYWMNKIDREESTLCRGCGMGEETAEHVLLECPVIHLSTRGTLATAHHLRKTRTQ